MNEQLQQAVSTLITKSIAAFETGATFMAAEIPDLVHQLMVWYAVKSVVFCVGGITLLVVSIIVDYKLFRFAKKQPDVDVLVKSWGFYGCIPRFFVYSTSLTMMNLTWLQIWIAPKIWLIEYATKMVTK